MTRRLIDAPRPVVMAGGARRASGAMKKAGGATPERVGIVRIITCRRLAVLADPGLVERPRSATSANSEDSYHGESKGAGVYEDCSHNGPWFEPAANRSENRDDHSRAAVTASWGGGPPVSDTFRAGRIHSSRWSLQRVSSKIEAGCDVDCCRSSAGARESPLRRVCTVAIARTRLSRAIRRGLSAIITSAGPAATSAIEAAGVTTSNAD